MTIDKTTGLPTPPEGMWWREDALLGDYPPKSLVVHL